MIAPALRDHLAGRLPANCEADWHARDRPGEELRYLVVKHRSGPGTYWGPGTPLINLTVDERAGTLSVSTNRSLTPSGRLVTGKYWRVTLAVDLNEPDSLDQLDKAFTNAGVTLR